jgi:hypothetical protein
VVTVRFEEPPGIRADSQHDSEDDLPSECSRVAGIPGGSATSSAFDTRNPDVPAGRSLRRDLVSSTADGASFGVMVGIGETYVPAFVLAVGLGEVFAGLIASIPVLVGSILQLTTPWGVQWLRSHRRWVVLCSTVQGLCFLPLVVAALAGSIPPWAALLITSIYWGSGLATGSAWNTWQGTVVPPLIRANFFARRARLQQVTTLVGFLAGGIALQWGRAFGEPVLLFAATFAIAFACRMLSVVFLAAQSEPVPMPPGQRQLSLKEQWARFSSPLTGRLLRLAVVMQAGVWVAGPFFNPYMLKVLEFTYVEYAALLGISFVAKFLTLPFWGRVAKQWGASTLLWWGVIGVVPLAIGWNVSSNYWWLLSLQVLAGTAWGAYELAIFLLFFETIPAEERTSVLTWYNFANSAALLFGSAVGATILKVGGVTPEAYHMVYAVSTVMRGMSLFFLWKLPQMSVAGGPAPLRPLTMVPSAGSVDSPVLPGLPDQTQPASAARAAGGAFSAAAVLAASDDAEAGRTSQPGTPAEVVGREDDPDGWELGNHFRAPRSSATKTVVFTPGELMDSAPFSLTDDTEPTPPEPLGPDTDAATPNGKSESAVPSPHTPDRIRRRSRITSG